MTKQRTDEVISGTPLMVCLNDCALDQGQPWSELAPVCFKLGCAFAEMRWKGPVKKNEEIPMTASQRTFQICSNRLHR